MPKRLNQLTGTMRPPASSRRRLGSAAVVSQGSRRKSRRSVAGRPLFSEAVTTFGGRFAALAASSGERTPSRAKVRGAGRVVVSSPSVVDVATIFGLSSQPCLRADFSVESFIHHITRQAR